MTIDELKQEISRLSGLNENYVYLIKQRDTYNKALQEKIGVAVKALNIYANENLWIDCRSAYSEQSYRKALFCRSYRTAQEALAKIKEIK